MVGFPLRYALGLCGIVKGENSSSDINLTQKIMAVID
jgi:hypothetical protein